MSHEVIHLENYLNININDYKGLIIENLGKKEVEEVLKNVKDTNLENLHFQKCTFQRLDIEFPLSLRILHFHSCKLEKIPNLKNYQNMEELKIVDCYIQKIENLPPMIKTLNLSYNQIYTIDYSNLPNELIEINMSHNFLSVVPPEEWRHKINYRQNNIEEKDVIKAIIGQPRPQDQVWNNPTHIHNIYRISVSQPKNILTNNGQSVHLSSVNNSIYRSITKIKELTKNMKPDPTFLKDLFYDVYGNMIWRNMKYPFHILFLKTSIRDTSVHSQHNVTYKEMLEMVWYIIKDHPQKKNLCERFRTEIGESIGYCFTGRINRLIHVLSTFVEGVNIGISEEEEMQMLIQSLIRRLNEKKIKKSQAKNEMIKILDDFHLSEDRRVGWLDALEDYGDDDEEKKEEEKKENLEIGI